MSNMYQKINFILSNLILFMIFFLLSSKDISSIVNIRPFINFYKINHSSHLIYSIIPVNSDENCPKGTSPLRLFSNAGTSEGCLISQNILKKGSCSLFDKIFHETKSIKETNEKNFYFLFSKKLCVKKDSKNYSEIIKKNSVLSDTKKLCGILDSLGTEYYVEEKEECPINTLLINENETINENFTSIQLNEKMYLHYSNIYNNGYKNNNENKYYLLSDNFLKFSEGLPCIKPDEKNTFHIQYLLDKDNESYICNTAINIDENSKDSIVRFDDRYKSIFDIQKNILFDYNNITLENEEQFPLYPYINANLTLYKINYIGINNLIDINDETSNQYMLFNQKENINQIHSFNQIYIVFIRINSTIFVLFIINFFYKYYIVDDVIYIFNILMIGVSLLIFGFSFYIKILLNQIEKFDKYYNDEKNDAIFRGQLKYIEKILNDANNKNGKIFIYNFLVIVLSILIIILNYFIFNNPGKKNQQTNLNEKNSKIFSSINVLKPTNFDLKKDKLIKFNEEIELSKMTDNIETDDNKTKEQ